MSTEAGAGSVGRLSTYFACTAQLPNPTSAAFCLTQAGGDVGAQQVLCLDALGQLGKVVESTTGVLAGQTVTIASREQSTFDRVGNRTLMALKDASGTTTHRQRGVTYPETRCHTPNS